MLSSATPPRDAILVTALKNTVVSNNALRLEGIPLSAHAAIFGTYATIMCW